MTNTEFFNKAKKATEWMENASGGISLESAVHGSESIYLIFDISSKPVRGISNFDRLLDPNTVCNSKITYSGRNFFGDDIIHLEYVIPASHWLYKILMED